MKIVIDIPEHYIENNIKRELPIILSEDNIVAILPKGHGRLGDLDALYQDISNGIKAGNYEEGYEDFENINSMDDIMQNIKYAPTVIRADKDGQDGR